VGEAPAALGRPGSTPPKLVDEYLWIRARTLRSLGAPDPRGSTVSSSSRPDLVAQPPRRSGRRGRRARCSARVSHYTGAERVASVIAERPSAVRRLADTLRSLDALMR